MMSTELATFAAGCFWCVEAVFQQVPGVLQTQVGYMGGHTDAPTYKAVCDGDTNHAEVVQLTYDPEQVTYQKLLSVFFANHEPTTLNRQGPDVGTQYRSAIFPHSPEQHQEAQAMIAALNASNVFKAPVVTTLEPLAPFYLAEDYHQQYYAKNRIACALPKQLVFAE